MANFFGDMYDNVLMGGPDADVLWGGMGDDRLSGGAGDDRLIGGPGADALDGGPGMDVASYTASKRGVRVDLSTSFSSGGDDAPVRGGDAEGDSLTSIESIWGSHFADLLIGSRAANYLFGNGGNDRIWGGGGNDLLRGGDDDDVLGEDAADPSMVGSERGNDTLYGDAGFDYLGGGAGNDMLFGGMDDDTLMGGDGNDMLAGGMGADHLDGGMGYDVASYAMSGEAVTVNLSVAAAAATATNPRVAGGDATGDSLMDIEDVRGSMHDDMLTGDDMGAPVAAVLGDNPATTGTTETDFEVEAAKPASRGNTLYGNQGNDKLKGMAGNDTLHGGKGDDTLYGGDDNDTLMGDMGDDALKGGKGDDKLVGGPGADVLLGYGLNAAGTAFADDPDGDTGLDTADYTGSDAGVTIDLGRVPRGQAEGKAGSIGEGGHAEGDVLHSIENLTGSDHIDLLQGSDANNVLAGGGGDDWDDPETLGVREGGLFGGDGEDRLSGGDGNDWLEGGNGRDDLWGGDGDDMLVGGGGNDRSYYIDDSAVLQNLDSSLTRPFLTMGQPSADNHETNWNYFLFGTGSPDPRTVYRAGLFGGAGNDTLDGGDGADWADGGEGDDTIIFGGSNDFYLGGPGTDTLDASRWGGAATVSLRGSNVDSIENAKGAIGGGEILGDDLPNRLEAGRGNTELNGRGGDDTLVGGAGNDTMNGGPGADTFVFAPGGGNDTIAPGTPTNRGFSTLEGDKIDLTAYGLNEDDLQALIAQQGNVGNLVTLNLGAGGLGFDDGGAITISLSGTRDQTLGLEEDDFII